ncbi:hypothetical protein [Fulvivirga sediminis]|uniref:Lipoprotein n=1 Tax=Fulvivirga sediminis TaxID=2803949 RepID=A0A937K2C9_9BACT|nr:hypothetical protein [Fulvivirga sediminis]MBL3657672.1 hypothetical protein [Fulvivirga sediminis]
MKIVKLISLLFILGVFFSATSCHDPYDEITSQTQPNGVPPDRAGPRD